MIERYATFRLRDNPDLHVVVLSYPGLEQNGTVVVAPLLTEDSIAVVPVLHPVVETPSGRRVVVAERMSALSPKLLGEKTGSLTAYEYEISRALSRLFFGN
jgi:hypothetical protein